MRRAMLLALAVAGAACRPSPADAPAASGPPLVRQLGAWNGSGNATLGFVSESGSFRITWKAQNQDDAKPGAFQLTLRSGISGRPMKVIADHTGAGGGSVEFGDDPRMYEFLVESNGIKWSVGVQETFATQSPR
jgi:hypothetical protein